MIRRNLHPSLLDYEQVSGSLWWFCVVMTLEAPPGRLLNFLRGAVTRGFVSHDLRDRGRPLNPFLRPKKRLASRYCLSCETLLASRAAYAMKEIIILLVPVFGFSAVIQATILAHRHLPPRRPLQGVDRKRTSRKRVCPKRWQAGILQLVAKQAQLQRLEALPG
jgi:hypothetical protein